MNNILENFEKDQMQQLMTGKTYPEFNAGDTLKVHLKVKEGEKVNINLTYFDLDKKRLHRAHRISCAKLGLF